MMLHKISKVRHSTVQTVLFWLLLSSGPLKSVFIYLGIAFDLTLITFVLVFFDVLFTGVLRFKQIHISTKQWFYSATLLVFYLFWAVSLIYTKSTGFGYEKVYLFLPCLLSFFYGLFVKKIDFELLFKLYLYIFLPISVWFLLGRNFYYTPNSIVTTSFELIKTNYLNFGVGVSLFVLLAQYLKKKWFYSLVGFVIVLGLGSRGALLFLVLVILVWKFKKWAQLILFDLKIRKQRLPFVLFSFLLTLALGITFHKNIIGIISVGIDRFSRLGDFSKDIPSLERIDRLAYALKQIFGSAQTFFIGNGIGSFGILYNGIDAREYPHNIFVEAWFELGIIGFVFLLALMTLPLIFKFRKDTLFFILAFVYLFLNALKTGDMVSIWTVYTFIGAIIFKINAKD